MTDRAEPGLREALRAVRYPWPDDFGTREARGWNAAFEAMLAAIPTATDEGLRVTAEGLMNDEDFREYFYGDQLAAALWDELSLAAIPTVTDEGLRAALEEIALRGEWADTHGEGLDPLPIAEMARAALAAQEKRP